MEISDNDLITLWHEQGGAFHGPNVETGTMPAAQLLPLLRELVRCRQWLQVNLVGVDGLHVSTGGRGRETPLFSAVDVQAFTSIGFAMRNKHLNENATHFAFLVKRPQDRQSWPLLFGDRARAEAYPERVSAVVPVRLAPYPCEHDLMSPNTTIITSARSEGRCTACGRIWKVIP